MREDDLPRVLRSGTSEFAALADVPDPALIRRRGDLRRRRKAVLSGVLAFVIGAGGGGFAYASFAKPTHSSPAVAGSSGSSAAAAGAAGVSQPPGSLRPGIVAVTTAGVVEVLDPETLAATRQLTGDQDAIGDQVAVSPDGKTVYFAVRKGCGSVIKSVPVDGSAQAKVVKPGVLPAVSPDGTKLAYVTEPYSGGPQRVTYDTCNGEPSPEVTIMDLAATTSTTYQVPGGTPVSHVSWSPDGRSLLVSLGPAGGNQGWQLDTLPATGSTGFVPAPSTGTGAFAAVPVTGDSAATSYYREGIYLPGGGLLVNRICCTGAAAQPTSSLMLRIDPAGNVQQQVSIGFLDKDHTSLAADSSGKWILYLSGNDLFVSGNDAKPVQVTIGLVAAAWL